MTYSSELPHASPESQGVASASILSFVEAVEKDIHDLHSFMLLRHGKVIAEGWWSPYAPQRPHMLFSLSKSFTSTAVGLAVAEGRFTTEDSVLSFFPESAPLEISNNLAGMKVHHLLAMCTGHADDTTDRMRAHPDQDWVKGFLALPVEHEPGTHFLYNTGATYMLSAIIQKVTGVTLLEYLKPRLLEPLGIEGATWETSPQGINLGGWGLMIKTEDIARFGQMYLQKGLWQGKQIVSAAWIAKATSLQISNGTQEDNEWEQGYGYQFWRCCHNAYRGDGAFGQYCVVMPDQDAVLAMTGGLGDMQPPLKLVWEHLLAGMRDEVLPPASQETQEKLAHKLASLACFPPQGNASSPIAAAVSGKSFLLDSNPLQFECMRVDFSEDNCVFTLHNMNGEQTVSCGIGTWQEGRFALFDYSPWVAASAVWTAEATFEITLRAYETPFVFTMRCHFKENRLTVDSTVNVSFGPTQYTLTGKMV